MATVRTVFKKAGGSPVANSKGEAILYLRYTHKAAPVYFSSGVSLRPEFWDESRERVRRGCPDKLRVEAKLKNKRDQLGEAIRQIELRREEATGPAVKAELNRGPRRAPFAVIVERYLEAKRQQSGYSRGSFYVAQKMGEKLARVAGNTPFDNKALKKILGTISETRASTQGNYHTFLKALAKWAIAQGYEVGANMSGLKSGIVSRSPVWFNPEEIQRIAETETPRPDVRDNFVFQAVTGLRLGDSQRVTAANIDGNFLKLETQKRGSVARPPLTKLAREVWARNNFQFPKHGTSSFNTILKQIIEAAGFTEQIEITIHEATGRRAVLVRRCDAASSHSGPKSFISNCLNNGIPLPAVARFTGKRIETLLRHYSGADSDTAAEQYGRLFSEP